MHANLAVLNGTLVSEPIPRELPSGAVVYQFDITTHVDRDGKPSNVTVPVAWHDPSTTAIEALRLGAETVVIGRVERRFFRSGGSTQSRTEVVACNVLPARRTKTVRSLVSAAFSSVLE